MSPPTGVKLRVRLVDVGRQHLDAHVPALAQVQRRLVLVVLHGGEQRGHVLGRVVRLEERGPVRHQAVPGGVRLVERVVRERDEDVPQRLDRALGVPVGAHPAGERDVLLVEDLLLLLAHRAAQQVRAAERVAGELLRDRHDLLLVHDQAVRVVQDLGQRLGQLGMDRLDRLAPVLAVGVVVVRVGAHRPGPVQRQHRGDVLERVRLHRAQQRPHRAAVELEHPERVTAGEQLVRLRVVQPELLQDDGLAAVRADLLQAVVEHREVAQAEEVHLEQAERLARAHVQLGDDGAVLLAPLDRDDVEQRLGAQDHAGGVHAPLALEALEPAGGVDDPLHVGVGVVERAELPGLGETAVWPSRRCRRARCPCPSPAAASPW